MLTIINDNTGPDELFPKYVGRGLDLSMRPKGFAYSGTAEPFPTSLVIPRSEWQSRIKELETTGSRLSDLTLIPCKDQSQTNFCWGNAPTYCVEILRVLQNQSHVTLSPASVCAQITNYKNIGGWGKAALDFITKKGIVPVAQWPANAINKQYATPTNIINALKYRVDEWWELEPGNIDHVISVLLRRTPIAVGYNWWSHEVTLIDPIWLDNDIAIRFRNSWGMGYGQQGYGILQGKKMLPDDAVAPRTVKAS